MIRLSGWEISLRRLLLFLNFAHLFAVFNCWPLKANGVNVYLGFQRSLSKGSHRCEARATINDLSVSFKNLIIFLT